MSVPGGESVPGQGSFVEGDAGISAADRVDGPDDTLRAKFRPESEAAARQIRQDVSVRHELGDVLTADVTKSKYDTLTADDAIEASPVQQVDLAQWGGSADVNWQRPTDGETVSGSVDLRIDVDTYYDFAQSVTWSVDGGSGQSADRIPWTTMYGGSWDTTGVADGTHELTATVELDGGETVTETIQVTVDNGNGGGSGDDGSTGGSWGDENQSPTVSFSHPGDGASVSGEVSLQIEASDPDGTVDEVNWAVDGGQIQSATQSGSGTWEATWDTSSVSSGSHELTAAAVDESGSTTRTSITVQVGDSGGSSQAPSVSYQTPIDGGQVEGQTSLSITASDPDGSVQEVRWAVDGGTPQPASYNSDAGAWTATWDASTVSGGTHELQAAAIDDSGTRATTQITVDVAGADGNQAPSVTWHTPSNGDSIQGKTSLWIGATDSDGSVQEVRWRVDNQSFQSASQDGSGSWTAAWDTTEVGTGTHQLTAVAVDDQGVERTSTISVDVLSPAQPPSVSWESPSDGKTINGTVPIEIRATDQDGSVQQVGWRPKGFPPQNATRNGDTWTAELNASDVPSGEYELIATAADDDRLLSNTSITVSVDSHNREPAVNWVSPHDNETVEGTVDLQIDAADEDGSIEAVAWGIPDQKRPTNATYDDSSGYWTGTLDVSNLPEGTHTLKTRAFDEQGTSTTDTIDVTVDSSNDPPAVSWDAPSDGETVSGEIDVRFEATDSDDNLNYAGWTVNNRTPMEPSESGDYFEDTLDTTNLENGEHILRAGAEDKRGAQSFEKITITVDNENGAGTPSLSWNWPEDGAVLAPHEVPIKIDASVGDGSIANIRWQVDDGPLRTLSYNQNAGHYEATWDASTVASGVHTLRAGVETEDGDRKVAEIDVTVSQNGDGANTSNQQPSSEIPYGVRAVYGMGPDSQPSATPRGGEDVDVAVVDSGIDVDHPDLRSSFSRCLDVADTGGCQDQNGHGTHLAGVVAADGTGGIYGVAPDVNLHGYKVVDQRGSGHADDVAAAIDDAAANDVEIVVLGATTQARGSLVEKEIAEHSDDLLVVAAAGNNGPETGTIAPPAAAADTVAVGAIGKNGEPLESSSRGITASNFRESADRLELVAAGENVESTWHDGGYRKLSGTSVATPHVAGVAALAWSTGQADANGDGEVTPAEVRMGLRKLAQNQDDGGGYDPATGVGMPVIPTG